VTQYDQFDLISEPDVHKPRKSAISRVLGWLLGWSIMMAAAALAVGGWAWLTFTAAGPNKDTVVVMFEKGLNRSQISYLLQDKGIIGDARVFSAAAALNALRGRFIKPGEYSFEAAASMRDILAVLQAGRVITYKITIPEGWTTEMAVARLRENDVLTGEITALPPEGALVANTLTFHRGHTRQELLAVMQQDQAKLVDELWSRRSADSILKSRDQMLTLASIVEKETGKADERPVIAAVFLNRLKQGIKLQSDPTIIYGIVGGKGKLDRPLTRADIDTKTPYNTYAIEGLPPGPIATPGRASLEAVINPAPVDYLYFVADGSGGHAFARTLDEHNSNVAKWRKLEDAPPPEPVADLKQSAEGLLAAVPLEAPVVEPAPAPAVVAESAVAPAQVHVQAVASTESTTAIPVETADLEGQPVLDLRPGSVIKVGGKLVPVPAERKARP
jgi:UPF0755 protein